MESPPLPPTVALAGVVRCIAVAGMLLVRRRVHLSDEHVGMRVSFADGTTSRIYRETTIDRPPASQPCALVVEFRLRGVRGLGHAAFRLESLLNTPLFVGFTGFVSKLWLANDERGTYRGLYEWDGPEAAEHYARCLWWVLALVSARDSIHYRVQPGTHSDDLLHQPSLIDASVTSDSAGWWRPVATA